MSEQRESYDSVSYGIRGLQIDGGPDIVAGILKIYLANSPVLLEEVRQAVKTGDFMALRRASHTLKSSSATIGALPLSDMCRELEAIGSAEAPDRSERNTSELVAAIEVEFDRVRGALCAMLGR